MRLSFSCVGLLRGVGTLRKHAGGMFLVPIAAAMPPYEVLSVVVS